MTPETSNATDNAEGAADISVCHYFVDEAGDGYLFNKDKEIAVGRDGCSSFFILGLLDVFDPVALDAETAELRASLLADPYLARIPSMQPAKVKTAIHFHAKDDCPEVRAHFFKLLVRHEMKFFAVVRDKNTIAGLVKEHNKIKPRYRYHPNQLYDRCVSRLFRDRLHKDDGYSIRFSLRGNKPRTEFLESELELAKTNFRRAHKIESFAPIEIMPSLPRDAAGLQAVDYILWALQRVYEREDERYWEFISEKVSLVHDVEDTRTHNYGEYYDRRNQLTAEKVKRPRKKEPGI